MFQISSKRIIFPIVGLFSSCFIYTIIQNNNKQIYINSLKKELEECTNCIRLNKTGEIFIPKSTNKIYTFDKIVKNETYYNDILKKYD